MAAAFEGSSEELVHNLARHVVVDETTRHHKYVGIVVLTDEVGDLGNPAQTGSHLLVLVQGDADTLTTATDGDTGIDLTALDTLSEGMTEVGIIDGGVTPSTVVLIRIALLLEILEYEFL